MAIGNRASDPTCSGTASLAATYHCPECNTTNVTAVLSAGIDTTTAPVVYASLTCVSCGKHFLMTAQLSTVSLTIQQVD